MVHLKYESIPFRCHEVVHLYNDCPLLQKTTKKVGARMAKNQGRAEISAMNKRDPLVHEAFVNHSAMDCRANHAAGSSSGT